MMFNRKGHLHVELDQRGEAAPAGLRARAASVSPVQVEHLEPRRLFAATLQITNLDVVPGFERMIFNRIRNVHPTIPNVVKDRGTLKFTNTGDQTLRFSDVNIEGPFRVAGQMPLSLAPGKSVNVTVLFTAHKLPKFTYNQTAGTTAGNKGGSWIGSLSFKTNDPTTPTSTTTLAGWFQTDNEKNQEPGLQTIVNLLSDYKTNIHTSKVPVLDQPADAKKVYGEEVLSAYWQAADQSKVVGVRHLASFHTQGDTVTVLWFKKTNKTPKNIYTTAGVDGQAFLPSQEGKPLVKANGNFAPGSATFGFKIQNEWSDDTLNAKQTGGGHHIRFFPLRDHFGNLLANTYIMTMDYSDVAASQNWDFQDNVYIVTNITPAGN